MLNPAGERRTMKKVEITIDEYSELKEKAEEYDRIVQGGRRGGKKSSSNMTKEQLSTRAKKAVEARIRKHNQKRSKQ